MIAKTLGSFAALLVLLVMGLAVLAVFALWGVGMALCQLGAWALDFVGEHAEDFE